MRHRWGICLLLCTLIVSCGVGTPAPTAMPANVTAAPTNVRATAVGTQAETGAPTTSPTMPTTSGPPLGSEAPPTEVAPPGEEVPPGAAPTELGPPGEEVPPGGEGPGGPPGEGGEGGEVQGPDPEIARFRARWLGAIAALAKLPGYTYTVEHASSGLTLTGDVASPTERSWTVAVTGHSDRVVARWVLTGGNTYTDLSGEWQRTEMLPFDPYSPVSFGSGGEAYWLVDYAPGTVSARNERVGSLEAPRLEVEQTAMDEGGGPGTTPCLATTTVWIARDGGYLLRHQEPPDPSDPEAGGAEIVVTPQDDSPEIRAPKIGTRAFEGPPPPWRALIVGRERLAQLPSYRFEIPGLGKGQVSDTKGRLSGVFSGDGETSKLELIYIGDRMWGREHGGPWRLANPAAFASGEGDEGSDALYVFTYAPGGVPRGLLPDSQEVPTLNESVFGLNLAAVPYFPSARPQDLRFQGIAEANGVRALRYTGEIRPPKVTEAGEGDKVTVEVWLAEEGHYLVRSSISGSGLGDMGMEEGIRTQVYDAGKPFEVKAPTKVAAPRQQGPPGQEEAEKVAWEVAPTESYTVRGSGSFTAVDYRDCLAADTTYTIPFTVTVDAEGDYSLRLVSMQQREEGGVEASVQPDRVEGESSGRHEATLTFRTGGEEQFGSMGLTFIAEGDAMNQGGPSSLMVDIPCIEAGEPSP